MDVEITKQGGNASFTLASRGINVRDFIVGSIPVSGIYGSVEGRSGTVDYGASYGTRSIEVPIYFTANNYPDFSLLRDALFEITTSKEPVYIREMRRTTYQTGENRFVGGKRYLVRITGEYSIDQMFKHGFGTLTFETVGIPFAESIGTTRNIHLDGLSASSGLWGFGMGLEAVNEKLIYEYEAVAGQRFRVFNAGSASIHPFEQELKITISDVDGSASAFRVNNLTNGTRFWSNVPISNTDVIEIDGPNVSKNSTSFLRDTGKHFIELSPGWNEFNVLPQFCDRATIRFDFRFYYL